MGMDQKGNRKNTTERKKIGVIKKSGENMAGEKIWRDFFLDRALKPIFPLWFRSKAENF